MNQTKKNNKREMKNEISMNGGGGEGKEIISFFNIYIVVYTHTHTTVIVLRDGRGGIVL